MSKTLRQKLVSQGKMIKMDRCRYCHSIENLTLDHKIPKIQGGTDDIKNLQCLCYECNKMKSGFSHKQLQNIFRWLKECEKRRG